MNKINDCSYLSTAITKSLNKIGLREFERCLSNKDKLCSRESDHISDRIRFHLIGQGLFRRAYEITGKCVLKLAMDDRGAFQNLKEFQTWKKYKDDKIGKLLLPIQFSTKTGSFTIVPKVDKIANYLNDEKLHREIQKHRLHCTDLHPGNIGLLNRRPVIIDYGFGVCKL